MYSVVFEVVEKHAFDDIDADSPQKALIEALGKFNQNMPHDVILAEENTAYVFDEYGNETVLHWANAGED